MLKISAGVRSFFMLSILMFFVIKKFAKFVMLIVKYCHIHSWQWELMQVQVQYVRNKFHSMIQMFYHYSRFFSRNRTKKSFFTIIFLLNQCETWWSCVGFLSKGKLATKSQRKRFDNYNLFWVKNLFCRILVKSSKISPR